MPRSLDDAGREVETQFSGMSEVRRDSGFRMAGFFVWGGSVIRVGDTYHMFASRWPEETQFPQGYMAHSEIVRAESKTPEGPYEFCDVAVHGRGGSVWDGQMAHNPTIHKMGEEYVLFYIGRPEDSRNRKVGYATAEAIEGPWERVEEPLQLGDDANNPAPCLGPDGVLRLAFRDRELRMGIATAPHYRGPYEIREREIPTGIRLEDAYLYCGDGRYHIVCEDNRSHVSGHDRWGVHLVSEDGIGGWRPADPAVAYTHTIRWEDGTTSVMERRERPQLVFGHDGTPSHLCTGVLFEGKTWCLVQAVSE